MNAPKKGWRGGPLDPDIEAVYLRAYELFIARHRWECDQFLKMAKQVAVGNEEAANRLLQEQAEYIRAQAYR